jgi:hypothetical protein
MKKVYMKTTETEMREEPATTLCRMLVTPVKGWFFVIALVLLFMSLCVAVFAGEPGQQSGYCDLQSGLAGTLNLSQTQYEGLRQLTDRFRNDAAIMREKIMKKRLELWRFSEDSRANPYAINKVERELNALEQEFYRRAQQTEAEQRRLLAPEQIKKIKDMPYGYDSQGYRRK